MITVVSLAAAEMAVHQPQHVAQRQDLFRNFNLGMWTSARAADVMKRQRWMASILFRQVKHQVGPDREDRQSAARTFRLQHKAETNG